MDSYVFEMVIVLSAAVLVLVIAMFALARQIGVLHTRMSPAGNQVAVAGPKEGQPSPLLSVPDLQGNTVTVGGARDIPQLLLFVSPTCPICKELVPLASSMADNEKLSLVFGSDGGQVKKHSDYVSKMGIEKYPYVVSLELGMKFEVDKLPYAVLIDEQGIIRSKGLLDGPEHLENLVESMGSDSESGLGYPVKEQLIGDQA